MSARWTSTIAAVTMALLAAAAVTAPGPAAAAPLVETFELSPPAVDSPITTQYASSSYLFFDSADGYLPYRRSVPGMAHSGSFVADAGSAACLADLAGSESCTTSAPRATVRLTRTAASITLYAGLFQTPTGAVAARLTAYRSDGTVAGQSGNVPLAAGSFASTVTVTSTLPDIAWAVLEAVDVQGSGGAAGSTLGFDDVTLNFGNGGPPQVVVVAPTQPGGLLIGGSLDIPIGITRVNGSQGTVDLSIDGLPDGVTGTFNPDPVNGVGDSAVLHLTAAGDAGVTNSPITAVITADPLNNTATGLGPTTANVPISLRQKFTIGGNGGASTVAIPGCSPVDVPVHVDRDTEFTTTVSLLAATPGLSHEFLPSASVPAETALRVNRTLRLSRTIGFTAGSTVLVTGIADGAPTKTLTLTTTSGTDTATIDTTEGSTPRKGQPGTLVTLSSAGFCPGSTVRVGNALATAPTTVSADRLTMTFRVPRLATSGTITIVRPDSTTYPTSNTITIDSVRNVDAFSFANYSWGSLSYDELTSLVGTDVMYIRANPCYPWYDCSFSTGIPSPSAYIAWGIIAATLKSGNGHCFGIMRTAQELLGGRASLATLQPGATNVYDPSNAGGPGEPLSSWLDARQASQYTTEYLGAYLGRSQSISTQMSRLSSELAAGRYPGLTLRYWPSLFSVKGHAVMVYDIDYLPDGTARIYAYDNNAPYLPSETANGTLHQSRMSEFSVITVNAARSRWSFQLKEGTTWTGDESDFFAVTLNDIPTNPHLPSAGTLASATTFASATGAATVSSKPTGVEWLPPVDAQDGAATSVTLVAPRSLGAITHRVTGVKAGTYTEVVMGSGFTGSAKDVPTAAGVRDTVSGNPVTGTVGLVSGRARTLTLTGSRTVGGNTRTVQSTATVASGSSDSMSLSAAGVVTYRHTGAATSVRFDLTGAGLAGTSRFVTPTIPVGANSTVTFTLPGLSYTRSLSVVVRTGTSAITRTVLNASTPGTAVTLGQVSLAESNGVTAARARLVVTPVPQGGFGGVTVRVYRGTTLVATRGASVIELLGSQLVSVPLPTLPAGTYRVVVDASVTNPSSGHTVRATTTATVPLA